MINAENLLALAGAYILGSIPSAVWIGKALYGIDVREYGSGNAGATNTFRVLGKKAGIPVLLLDIIKGFVALQLVLFVGNYLPGTQQYITFKLTLGIAALLGHIFPVFAGFRGGKGVATLLGILIGVQPVAALICSVIFLVVLLVSGYVSLGSMSAAIAYPFIIMLVLNETIPIVNIFAMAVAILVLITHQKNIERLLRGSESKVAFLRKKNKTL
ncbi:MAG: glycerol-3-phosphate 1-O-acyltransferase PlsY [Bacteroidota bacterium]|nr:glycerol-3-phosphate 1-O-acyltransferase PlsY [Bacteroidota bacterium]